MLIAKVKKREAHSENGATKNFQPKKWLSPLWSLLLSCLWPSVAVRCSRKLLHQHLCRQKKKRKKAECNSYFSRLQIKPHICSRADGHQDGYKTFKNVFGTASTKNEDQLSRMNERTTLTPTTTSCWNARTGHLYVPWHDYVRLY